MFRRIVAPESDSVSVLEPEYVGVGEGVVLFVPKGVTVAAGLAEAVPAGRIVPVGGVEDVRPPAFVLAAQLHISSNTPNKKRFMLF